MKKLLKGIITSIFLSQVIFLMIPFNIHADTISSTNIIGIDKELTDYELINTISVNGTQYYYGQFTYTYTLLLDDNYLGYISGTIEQRYYGYYNNGTANTFTFTSYARPYYVNSNRVKINVTFQTYTQQAMNAGNVDPTAAYTPTFNITFSNVTKYSDIDSIQQIIDILNDIYTNVEYIEGLETNQLTELENIVSNTSMANDYLDIISKYRYYNFPFESFVAIARFMNEARVNSGQYLLLDYPVIGNWNYPWFRIFNGEGHTQGYFELYSGIVYKDVPQYLIYAINSSKSANNIKNDIQLTGNGAVISEVERLTTFAMPVYQGTNLENYGIYKFKIEYTGTGAAVQFRLDYKVIPFNVIPIYAGDGKYTSVEFATRFGLKNEFLNNIDLIVNGSTDSNQSASNLEDSNDQMASDMNDLASIESGYNQQFNNSLNDIDFTNPIQSNAGILPAANFVITAFNGLVNNPLSILIIIICILTIGKKVIGK